jgi:hypothetical protein
MRHELTDRERAAIKGDVPNKRRGVGGEADIAWQSGMSTIDRPLPT